MSKTRVFYCLPLLLAELCRADVSAVVQQPLGSAPLPASQSPVQSGPDERILWSLFHAGKIEALKRQITDLRQRFPDWQVPADLQKALGRPSVKTTPATQARTKRPATTAKIKDACAGIDRQWAALEAQVVRGQHQAAVAGYARILQGCRNPDLMEATLEKAAILPGRDDYFRLTALASDRLPETERQRLEYQWLKNAYLTGSTDVVPVLAISETELQPWLERFEDADLAVVIAWRYFDGQAYRKAHDWFAKAEAWQPLHGDVKLGKMLCLEKLQDYDAALAVYPADASDARIDEVAARLYKLKAWQDIQAARLAQAEQNLAKARALLTNPDPEIQQIEAWIADGRRHHAKAANLFADLYRQAPDNPDYARAYVRNQSRANRDELALNAEQSGGLLQDEYAQLLGREHYQRKQFLAAQDKTPTQFPNLVNIDAPSADLGVYARHKSGEPGRGRLDILKLPTASGTFTVDGIHTFTLSMSRMELDAGRAAACTALGSLSPKDSSACNPSDLRAFDPTGKLTNGLETDFLYRMDGWFSPYVRLGHTPTGGVIEPTITFDVGFVQQTETGNWSMNVYSQPVRQSILSYTGIRDPYHGQAVGLNTDAKQQEWGRVLRSGIRAAGFHSFAERWGISAAAEVAMLNGENVADNTAVAVSLNPSFNIPLAGFDYFSIGPAFAYEHYEKNLSHFTLGHGGYFSPEHYINVGPSLQFLSEEGRPLVFKGHVNAGVQLIEEADAPWFPLLAPGLGKYEAKDGFSLSDALDIELKGVWLLAPNLQLGAGAAVRHTANYEDFSGGLFVRVFFQDRKASYSTDIPNAMFNGIQAY